MGSSGAGQIQSVSFGEEAMRTAMLIAPVLFAPMAYGQQVGDQYILSEEGEIVLFALPGCEMQGKPGLYGLAKWKAKEAEIVCWKYDRVIYIYAPGERTIIFDPSEVRTRDVNEAHDSVYGLAPGPEFPKGNGLALLVLNKGRQLWKAATFQPPPESVCCRYDHQPRVRL